MYLKNLITVFMKREKLLLAGRLGGVSGDKIAAHFVVHEKICRACSRPCPLIRFVCFIFLQRGTYLQIWSRLKRAAHEVRAVVVDGNNHVYSSAFSVN